MKCVALEGNYLTISFNEAKVGFHKQYVLDFKYNQKITEKSRYYLRLIRTFAGILPCFREKIHRRAILKESTANYISLESLINGDFGKKSELPIFLIPQKKIAKMTVKMTIGRSIKQMN